MWAAKPPCRPSARLGPVKCAASSETSPSHGSTVPPVPPPPPATARHTPPPPTAQHDPQQQQQAAPWALGSYYTKKLSRQTDGMGNILSSPDTTAVSPVWTREAQLSLAAEALAAELQQDAAPLVQQLQALLPGMEGSLQRMKPAELVRMAAQLEQIGQRLIYLRGLLPTADVAAVVAAHPPLLRMSPGELEAALTAVREAFPDASQEDLDAMLSRSGALLDGGASLAACLAGAGHLMSRQQIMRCLQRDPGFLYQFQPLEGQARGERDADYLADMYRPR